MKRFIPVLVFAISLSAFGQLPEFFIEQLYNEISQKVESPSSTKSNYHFHRTEYPKVFLDVLWDRAEENNWRIDKELKAALNALPLESLGQEERFRTYLLKKKLRVLTLTDKKILDDFLKHLSSGKASKRSVMLYISQKNELEQLMLSPQFMQTLYSDSSAVYLEAKAGFRSKTAQEIQDLYYHSPVAQNFRGGVYENTPKLFMFCRHDRRYPCLMMMKDAAGNEVKMADGRHWHQPSLGLARRGVPFDQKNGYTPSGVYTMDSVMPFADQQKTFGQFRRVILNFIPGSENEELLKGFLPKSAHQAHWWKESVVARDIGRNLFRLHGTGRKNRNPFAKHYPFIKTSGCVMAREGSYGSKTYRDQRYLLDQIMLSAGLEAEYQNESRIKGIFYLIEIDNKDREVRYQDVMSYLKS